MCNTARFLHTAVVGLHLFLAFSLKKFISTSHLFLFLLDKAFFSPFFVVFMVKHLQYVSTLRLQIASCIKVRCLVQNCNLSFFLSFFLSFLLACFLSATLPIRLSNVDTVKITSLFFLSLFFKCYSPFQVFFV